MTLTKFNTLAFALLLAATASANSLDNIANISFTEGIQLKHLEFSITDKGILTHGNGGRKVETQKDRFGDRPQLPACTICSRDLDSDSSVAWRARALAPCGATGCTHTVLPAPWSLRAARFWCSACCYYYYYLWCRSHTRTTGLTLSWLCGIRV